MFNFFKEIKGTFQNSKKLVLDDFNIINISGKILYAEGHRGLVTLSKELISFKVKGGVIMVYGTDMILSELNENTIKIFGNITKTEQI